MQKRTKDRKQLELNTEFCSNISFSDGSPIKTQRFYILKFLFLTWKADFTENRIQRSSLCWLSPQRDSTVGARPSQSQEPGAPSRSSMWVQGPADAAFSGTLAGHWIGTGAARTPIGTPLGKLAPQAEVWLWITGPAPRFYIWVRELLHEATCYNWILKYMSWWPYWILACARQGP